MEVDYVAVLDDLRQRRSKLDAAISAIAEIVGDSPERLAEGGDPIPSSTVLDAAMSVLRTAGRNLPTTEIVGRLEGSGFSTGAKSLYSTLYTILKRESDRVGGGVVKVGNAWALPEWKGITFATKPAANLSGTGFAPKGSIGMSAGLLEVLKTNASQDLTSTRLLELVIKRGVVTTAINPLEIVDNTLLKLRKLHPELLLVGARTYRWIERLAAE